MADTPKATPPPQPIEDGTVFIKNPGGAIHDMFEATSPTVLKKDDEKGLHEVTLVELARRGEDGWRLASDDEIREYCERNNLEPPSKKAKAEEPAEAPAKASKK